jgi:hypothetical protein
LCDFTAILGLSDASNVVFLKYYAVCLFFEQQECNSCIDPVKNSATKGQLYWPLGYVLKKPASVTQGK